jgi:hypothetical protein
VGTDAGLAYEREGVAAGAPETVLGDYRVGRRLGSVVRALKAGGDTRVQEVTYAGRPCYFLDLAVEPDRLATFSPDRIAVTVDRGSGFPLRTVETYRGVLVRETRLESVSLAGSYSVGDYWLVLPQGVKPALQDAGFRATALDRAGEALGYSGYNNGSALGWIKCADG